MGVQEIVRSGPRVGEVACLTTEPATTAIAATIRAGPDETGLRLDRMLALRLPALSRTRVKRLIESGHVTCAGIALQDPARRVRDGQNFVVILPEDSDPVPVAQAMPLEILFEDEHLIVIDKPAGLVVHPAPGNPDGPLVNALISHGGASLSGIGGVRRPGIVHRLDKDTTGLMVVAKNDRAHRALSAQFADHGRTGPLQRGYLAFVWGVPDRPKGVIDKPIDRHPQARDRMAVRAGGRDAITLWEVLESYPAAAAQHGSAPIGAKRSGGGVASLLDCRLKTGRTHQIRVHLAAIGHPLLGDDTYGPGFRTKAALLPAEARAALLGLGRQALHAYLLGVEHPVTGENLLYRSNLPADLD